MSLRSLCGQAFACFGRPLRLIGSEGYLSKSWLLFGHGAAVACYQGAGRGWVCYDPLELSASVHDVKIAVLLAVVPCHHPVAGLIHRIRAIKDGVDICSSNSQ